MIKQEKVYPPLINLIARGAMDKEKVIHEIKRDLRSPMVFRGLLIIGMFFLMIIYQVFCWFTYCWWIEHKDIRIWFSKSNISYSLMCSHLAANDLNSGHLALGRWIFKGTIRYRESREVGPRSIWFAKKILRLIIKQNTRSVQK